MKEHLLICNGKNNYNLLIEGKDYINCKICNYYGKSLKKHLTLIHPNINQIEYEQNYGSFICTNSSKNYAIGNISHENWMSVAKREGKDLTEYKSKMSDSVRKSVLANTEDLKRRSNMMIALNEKQQQDPEFQKIVSDTAKKTSARKDIQEQRSAKLAKWREDFPEDFKNKCIKKMIASFNSKPERKLFQFLSTLSNFNFKRNQFIKSATFTSKTNLKQLDMMDKLKNIIIEFDGILHFLPKFGDDAFILSQNRDKQLEKFVLDNNYLLIRVSYDQYIDRNLIEKSFFKQECLDKVIEILNNNIPGVYKVGAAYG